MYRPLIPPTYHAWSLVGSTSIDCTHASPIGWMTLLQLKPATCCGGRVTMGMLFGHHPAIALAARDVRRRKRIDCLMVHLSPTRRAAGARAAARPRASRA